MRERDAEGERERERKYLLYLKLNKVVLIFPEFKFIYFRQVCTLYNYTFDFTFVPEYPKLQQHLGNFDIGAIHNEIN